MPVLSEFLRLTEIKKLSAIRVIIAQIRKAGHRKHHAVVRPFLVVGSSDHHSERLASPIIPDCVTLADQWCSLYISEGSCAHHVMQWAKITGRRESGEL